MESWEENNTSMQLLLRDKIFLCIFSISTVLAMLIILHDGISAQVDDLVDRDIHDSVVRTLQQSAESQKVEAGVVIASMASAIGILYINGRKDIRASRAVIAKLATALENLPCRPNLCTDCDSIREP